MQEPSTHDFRCAVTNEQAGFCTVVQSAATCSPVGKIVRARTTQSRSPAASFDAAVAAFRTDVHRSLGMALYLVTAIQGNAGI